MIEISPLASRSMSAFPLSIGTSLALESLFKGRQDPYDPQREIPKIDNIDDYKLILINVNTLIRNIVGSVDYKLAEFLTEREIIIALRQEILTIIDILIHEGEDKIKPYFYSRNYSLIKKTFFKAKVVKFNEPTTAKQIIAGNQITKTLKILKEDSEFSFIHWVGLSLIDRINTSAIMISHIPYDLLSWNKFNKLDLLESHTGILKTRKDFYTKYANSKKVDLSHIPFQRRLLAILGDNTMFKPFPQAARQLIIDLSNNFNWTAVTTEEKVNHDVRLHLSDIGLKQEYFLM